MIELAEDAAKTAWTKPGRSLHVFDFESQVAVHVHQLTPGVNEELGAICGTLAIVVVEYPPETGELDELEVCGDAWNEMCEGRRKSEESAMESAEAIAINPSLLDELSENPNIIDLRHTIN